MMKSDVVDELMDLCLDCCWIMFWYEFMLWVCFVV